MISFFYIAAVCLCIGSGILKALDSRIDIGHVGLTGRTVCGIVALTVFSGWISIFSRIGILVGITTLVLAVFGAYYSRKEITEILKTLRSDLSAADIIVGIGGILLIAYATSRGDFHTDTGIYHAAAIRLYEEYGSVKGIANLQLHYGYDSSYLGFASLFTFSRILPNALHTTTGFLMCLFMLDALYHLRDFRTHSVHYSDAARISILLYIFMNLTGAMSPATDYGTMLMTGYFLCAWLTVAEREYSRKEGTAENHTALYALLSVYAVFLVTMKLSAAMCVTVAVLPLIRLIRRKAYSHIGVFLGLGLFSFLFYPIRNIIQTGWLFYPFEAIDLFDVEWKVPVEYSLVDSAQIKVWGRCLFDVDKVDWPISQWLPIWWEAQEHYDQMLIYALFLGVFLIVLAAVVKRQVRPGFAVFYVMVAANLTVWFVTAPFIRYGLIFILIIPLLGAASAAEAVKDRLKRVSGYVMIMTSILIAVCFAARIDHYLMDDLVFVKHHLAENYYILQKPFDDALMDVEYIGEAGIPVYYTANDEEKNSYYYSPSTCYYMMLERTEPIGNTVKDGFRPK